jgi:hypothetical protein
MIQFLCKNGKRNIFIVLFKNVYLHVHNISIMIFLIRKANEFEYICHCLLLPPFQITRHFGFSRFMTFVMHLYMHLDSCLDAQ